jgi:hypothetical protein
MKRIIGAVIFGVGLAIGFSSTHALADTFVDQSDVSVLFHGSHATCEPGLLKPIAQPLGLGHRNSRLFGLPVPCILSGR